MARELRSPAQPPPVRLHELVHHVAGAHPRIQAEIAQETRESLGRGDLTVIDRAQPLGFLPARQQGIVERLQGDPGRPRRQDGVELADGGAHDPSVHRYCGQPLAVEPDEGVEEIEEHGPVRPSAHSALRLA